MQELLATQITQSSTAAARAPQFYRPELDTLRFGAFLLVLEHHTISDQTSNHQLLAIRDAGSYGVCLFFLLSAYLITELLLREKENSGDISLRRFYIRRVLRIWPLYFGFVFFSFCLSLVLHRPETAFPVTSLLACLLLAGNIAAAHGMSLGVAGILWSISVEEQFYLCWPLLIRVINRRNVLAIGGLLWIASEAATVIQIRVGVPYYPKLWFSSLVQFQFFALGIMLAALPKFTLPTFARVLTITAGLGLLLLAVNQRDRYLLFPLVSLGVVCVFVGTLGFRDLASKPLGYLGRISYGLYVFHVVGLFLAHFIAHRVSFFRLHPYLIVATLPLPLTILMASISYRYFETPFLKLKSRFEVVKTRPI